MRSRPLVLLVLTLAATAAQATSALAGSVTVQVKRGRRTISNRRSRVRRTCRFSSAVTFDDRGRLGGGRLKFTVRWPGNDVLKPRRTRAVRVRAG